MRFVTAIFILVLQLGDSSSSSSFSSSRYSRKKLFIPTHSNFLRSTYHYGGKTGIINRHEVRCRDNATICRDPARYPKGGICCFNSVCKNVQTDVSNCGGCNKACGYGLSCCHGRCVNLMSDPHHCGQCNTRCHKNVTCEFGLCGYAGESLEDDDDDDSQTHKARFPKQW